MPLIRAEPGKTRVGWVGTGVMGRWMCEHCIKKGFSATVYNRSKEKAQPLLDLGAKFAGTPKAVAAGSVFRWSLRGLTWADESSG